MSGAEQLDLFVSVDGCFARPTQRSATGVVLRAARRLGYDWCGQCVHCGQLVTLTGEWGPLGWVHRQTQQARCSVAALRNQLGKGI